MNDTAKNKAASEGRTVAGESKMIHFQLILQGRDPETHTLIHKVTCDGKEVISECTYQAGYRHIAQLMSPGDTFEEIQGIEKSRIMTYLEVMEGNLIMNWDEVL